MNLEGVTFFLAPVGYAGLTLAAVSAAYRRSVPHTLWCGVAAVIALHVGLVWHVRYSWDIAEATRNGWAGFVLFHSALAAIVASMLTPESIRHRLIWFAFIVVTTGALVAVFKYDVVAPYRFPVILCAAAGTFMLLRAYAGHRHTRPLSTM